MKEPNKVGRPRIKEEERVEVMSLRFNKAQREFIKTKPTYYLRDLINAEMTKEQK